MFHGGDFAQFSPRIRKGAKLYDALVMISPAGRLVVEQRGKMAV